MPKVANTSPILITIDGLSGAGKGTLARFLAESLGLVHCDSGAFYRAIGLAAEEQSRDPILVARDFQTSYLDHPHLRLDQGGKAAKKVAAIPEVRNTVNSLLKEYTDKLPGCVVDGRAGAWEYPHASVMIFLVASLGERAVRRCRLLEKTGANPDFAEVKENLRQRDEEDMSREVSLLKKHPDAYEVDNTDLKPHETLAKVVRFCIQELYEPKPISMAITD